MRLLHHFKKLAWCFLLAGVIGAFLLVVSESSGRLVGITRPSSTWDNAPSLANDAAAQPAGAGGIKTDRRVYAKPPLPALPRAGGKFIDPTFGTEIMRASDERDDKVGVSTFYSHWPTFNCNNTYILARKGSGDALIKSFDKKTFNIGAGFQPGAVNIPGKGDVSVNFESAIWHPTNPNLIYCFTGYRDGGMHFYTYDVVRRRYTLVKDFSPLGGPDDYLWRMTMSADGDVFAWSQMRVGLGDENPIHFIIWRKSTGQVLSHMPTKGMLEKIGLDKSGHYASIAYKKTQADKTFAMYLTVATGHLENIKWNSSDSPTGHGDMGTGFSAGFDNWACGINRRWLNDVHAPQTVFRFADEHGVRDWTNDLHATLLSDNEDWITVGTYREPSSTLPSTGVFRDEILQVALDGSNRIRRICHTRSSIDNKTDTTGYWAIPKPTISTDGRFIAFTSNWEKSGRYDLFIAKIDPAPRLSTGPPNVVATRSPQETIRRRRIVQPAYTRMQHAENQ